MTELRCERCGQEMSPEHVPCSRKRCPYTVRREKGEPVGCVPLVFGVGGAVLCTIWAVDALEMGWQMSALLLCPGFLAVGLAVAGVYLMFRQRVLLHNPATGAMWRRTSALGIETELVVTTGLAPLSIDLGLPRLLDYPPSITALYVYEPRELWWLVGAHPRNAYAYHVFRAAVIGLLARDVIGVRFAGSSRSRLGGRPRPARDAEYLIVPGENVPQDVDGLLEGRIVDAVRYWKAQPAAKQWPDIAILLAEF